VILTIPYNLPSAANLREVWQVKARRVRQQRDLVRMFIGGKPRPTLPVVVTLTRIAPRALDDDNLSGAFKAIRDEIADWLGVKDNHPGIVWAYTQERGVPKEYAIRVRVMPSLGAL